MASSTHLWVSTLAAALGVMFLLIGILGSIPGSTTNFGDITFAGHDSGAKLFGVFQVSILHNLIHLFFGVAGLLMARTASGARAYLIGGGAIYAVLWLYGLAIGHNSAANFVPVNTADNWLHLILAAAMLTSGLLAPPATPRSQ